jgi:hypothetical protein
MHRLTGLVISGAVAVAVVGVVAASPAAATQGGNSDNAHACQHGGWKTLVSQTAKPFKNQGDCVNDGAQGLGVEPGPPPTPEQACLSLPGDPRFTDEGFGSWTCSYLSPPGPAKPLSLEMECLGDLTLMSNEGLLTAECNPEGP